MDELSRAERRALGLQRAVGWLLAPVWVVASAGFMRFGMGWRIEGARTAREDYARLRRRREGPLMICANHLTLVDSFVVAWALGSPFRYLRDYGALPWNTPERANFAASGWQRALVWLAKCIPVSRGGDRGEVARVLARVRHLLARGDAVLMFPEGGRSRSGRVDPEAAAWGVGRVVRSVPGCRVLCVYLRGEGQESWSAWPRRGERFHVSVSLLEPKSDAPGLRGSRDVARQIAGRLATMEEAHLAAGR